MASGSVTRFTRRWSRYRLERGCPPCCSMRSVPMRSACQTLVAAGLVSAVPAALAGAADWSEQHEQQMRVASSTSWPTASRSDASRPRCWPRHAAPPGTADIWPGRGRRRRPSGWPHLLPAGGRVNHAEQVPHLVTPGWQYLMPASDAREGKPVRGLLGQVPVVAVRVNGRVHVLARPVQPPARVRCRKVSCGDSCLTCPWHGSAFRLSDGSVARGPATAPQPSFQVREAEGAIQVCLPGAG